MSATTDAVRALLVRTAQSYPPGSAGASRALEHLARLDSPLRLAVAGMVKAGKSTLVNALIGEAIAPTDAGECTRVVTWYQHAATPRVRLVVRRGAPSGAPHGSPSAPSAPSGSGGSGVDAPVDGSLARDLPVRREGGRLVLDLGGADAAGVERLVVDWPAPALAAITLIDTPGIASLSSDVSGRSEAFLTPADAPSSADAVVYLMRHLHAGDVGFLESFRDTAAGASAPAATIAVLSRADEVGSGRIDALLSAASVAARYRREPTLRALCQTVVPVAGLLAASASTLRQEEYAALRALAGADRASTARQLLSVDRFVAGEAASPVSPGVRAALLDRFGVFGVRLALTLLRSGMDDPTLLARDLVRRSGLEELRELLAVRFAGRAGALKARTALLALEALLRTDPPGAVADELSREVERVRASAHDLRELAVLAQLRGPEAGLDPGAQEDAEALLGATGAGAAQRLRADADADAAQLRAAARAAVTRWRARAANPLAPRSSAALCSVVVRSAEGVLASLPPT